MKNSALRSVCNRTVLGSVLRLLVVTLALSIGLVRAQTLRWASAGDVLTLDPMSQNESFTNSFNAQYYEFLVARDRNLGLVPGLATGWRQDGPLKWTVSLRRGVRFHDGRAFTADDAVFSVKRAVEKTSRIRVSAIALGEPKKVDDYTVQFDLQQVDPIFLAHLNTVPIMSKSWCEEHDGTRPQDFFGKGGTFTALHANGTGPYMLVTREPDVRTMLRRNPNYWAKIEGNVQDVIYTPIASPATRVAALISGEVDFILDPPPTDLERLRKTDGVKVIDGPENRVIFIGMDQARDELLYSSVKNKNPLKDVRVRKALYQAIDIDMIKTKLMNGQAAPTGAVVPSPIGSFNDPEIEKRLPYDVAAAKKLMAEAGYPDGFEVTLDCPNNRYINDERICIALASMWAQLKVKVKVNAMPKTTYFPKIDKLDTSMYMFGWGGSITDAEPTLTTVFRNRGDGGAGSANLGNYKDDELDALAAAQSREPDSDKRKAIIKQAFHRMAEQVHYIPLHRQHIPWASRSNVGVVHRADNWLMIEWVSIRDRSGSR